MFLGKHEPQKLGPADDEHMQLRGNDSSSAFTYHAIHEMIRRFDDHGEADLGEDR